MSPSRDAEAGLTLIEMLVVLAIVGIAMGVTVLGVGALDPGRRAEAEAIRLADRLSLAVDEAMVTSTPLAMVWDDRGYRFLDWDAAGETWRDSGQGTLGRRHSLPGALRLEGAEGDARRPVVITPEFAGQAAVTLRVAGGATTWQVAFDGFGATVAPVER